MKLPRLALENHRFTEVIVALLTALGVVSYLTMPRAEDPTVEIPNAAVVVVFPGADPEVVEALAIDPLEEAINEIEDLVTLESSVEDGVALITAEMTWGTDPEDAYDALLQEVDDVRPDLPEEIEEVEVLPPQVGGVPALQLALVAAEGEEHRLGPLAERLESSLETVSGVRRVDTWAHADREVRVAMDPQRMRALGVSVDQVAGAVRAAEAEIPGGFVTSGARRLNVRTSGDFASLEDVRRALVPGMDGRVVRLRDVADVGWAEEDEEHRARYDGGRAAFVTVVLREGTNIFTVLDRVRPVMAEAEASLPRGVTLHTVFDQSESVDARVGSFFGSLLQGIGLVGVVMFLFLGFRPALLVMMTIPLAILLALAGVDLTGYGLQQMTIVGLVIALGLLVDDAIVVVENIGRMLREGLPPMEAALEGTAEIGWPSASGTVTTVLAFLPMVTIQSGTGEYIRSLPVTVVYALLASLLISLTLTPLVASRILKGREEEAESASGADPDGPRSLGSGRGVLQRFLEGQQTGPYRRTLRAGLAHPWRVVAGGGAALALSLALFPLVGVSLFPKAEKPQFLIDVETPEGTSLAATDAVVRRVEEAVAARDEVVRWAANVGADNPQIYYNTPPRQPRSNIGQLMVELRSYDDARSVVPALRSELERVPGARITLTEFENGPPVEAPIVFKVTGPELGELERLASRIEEVLRETPGTRDVRNPLRVRKVDLEVAMDRDRLALLGLDPVTVDRTVRASLAGLEVGSYREEGMDETEIVARFPYDGDFPTVEQLDRVTLVNAAGRAVPLAQVASLELTPGTGRIDHYQMERVATVTAYPEEGAEVLAITGRVSEALEAMEWPDGYRWFAGGTFEEQQEGFAGMIRALLIAVLGIFAVLVLQFRSFLQPLIIFAAVPLAFVGAVGALLLTGYTFSFTAFIGITSLVGIVINNSIILVDYANRRVAAGDALDEALQRAGETRFQPIVLTTLTTVGGLLPLTLAGSTMWSPLGWTIIGGLLTSTVLTLVLVPALYRLAARMEGVEVG